MARLPIVGADGNSWGSILNDYLSQQHTGLGAHQDIKSTKNIASQALWTVGECRFDADSATTSWVFGDNSAPPSPPNNMIFIRGSFTGSSSGTSAVFLDSTIYGVVNGDIYGFVSGAGFVRASGGTHVNIFGTYMIAPLDLGGTAGVTNVATAYIHGGPTFGTNRYALWINAGTIKLPLGGGTGIVDVGIADSGGIGFRLLRVPN